MHYNISHSLHYSYSRAAFIEPLAVRLRPRSDSLQQVIQFKLDVIPTPDGFSEHIDQEGNNAATLWFSGKHRDLSISTTSEVEVSESNPFNYIVTNKDFMALPAVYSQSNKSNLQPYLSHRYSSPELNKFVRPIMEETDEETIPFIVRLNSLIYEEFNRVVRETGDPMAPEETLAKRQGACRDFAVLFMAGCRAVGLAARFVSGYRWSEDLAEKHNLHAWSEVYLPGAGWRGFDPSIGLAVSSHYVAVATAANPVDTAPVSGAFRGTGIKSRLEYNIIVKVLPQS